MTVNMTAHPNPGRQKSPGSLYWQCLPSVIFYTGPAAYHNLAGLISESRGADACSHYIGAGRF